MTVTVDLPVPARALSVGAHADDIEFGAGATLAKWAAAGCALLHVVCTDGSKGTWDAGADLAALVATRQDEQRAAARALGGAGDVEFRRFRPDVVLGHDPWKRYRLHPDHRHAGYLTVDAVVGARDPHFFPELGLEHHRPSALLLFEADEPDHVERVDGFADRKVAALLAHRSQLRSTMAIEDDGSAEQLDAFRRRVVDRLAEHGALGGVAEGEAFRVIRDL